MIDSKPNDKIDIACQKFKIIKGSGIPKFTKLDVWLEKESNIFKNETKKIVSQRYPNFKRGQIIKIDFGINIGSELSHTHFAIVLNGDDTNSNDNIIVLPITSKDGYKRIYLGKLLLKAFPNTKKYKLECYGYLTQITTISKRRVYVSNINYICPNNVLDEIDNNVKMFLTKCE